MTSRYAKVALFIFMLCTYASCAFCFDGRELALLLVFG